MQPTIWNGARVVVTSGQLAKANGGTVSAYLATIRRTSQWTCADCRLEARLLLDRRRAAFKVRGRQLTTTASRFQDGQHDEKKSLSPFNATTVSAEADSTAASQALPSHVENRRWQLSKDMTRFVDGLLARASIAGQHINAYTGTDYSGIEAMRRNIIEQEQKVKTCHSTVDTAKASHQEAYVKQASAQKEIVGLLERKSSWSPADLERYMSLVRSEHINDQTVQAAKDSLNAAEKELEDARGLLERLERKQYHEEQIWSDTIRRNSTWVTFGLMGVNIVLLLAQILIFEPYRRRRIVRDVKSALDERTLHPVSPEAEKQIDTVVELSGVSVESIEPATEERRTLVQPLEDVSAKEKDVGRTALAAGEVLPEEAVDVPNAATLEDPEANGATVRHLSSWDAYKEALQDLFSERLIQIRQVELTTVALQGAATGVAAMGLLFVLLRPK